MIEQLWYTWSKYGLGGALGFRVRAASAGLADTRSELVRASDPYLQYTLPLGTILEQADLKNSPVNLTFAEAGEKRVLIQRVFAGKDAYGRIGNYFCHLVAELPEAFCAQNAVDLWMSTFWEVSDRLAPDETNLALVSPSQLTKGSLRLNDLMPLRGYLPFVIQAYFSLETNQHLYIMAPDVQVATLIWGLTRCLPQKLQQRLTFSTYEYDVLRAETRIVGTSRPMTQVLDGYKERVADLPANCYDTLGFALNCYTNNCSPLPEDSIVTAYVDFAVKGLLESGTQAQKLSELLAKADRINVQETRDFLVIYKFFITSPEDFSAEDILFLLSRPHVAVELLTEPNIQQGVINFILKNPRWWLKDGKKMVESLVAEYPGAWLWVLQYFPMPSSSRRHPLDGQDWKVRKSFLEIWKQLKQSINDTQVASWLLISWSELPEVLKLELPDNWNIYAIKCALTDRTVPIPSNIVSLVMAYQALFEKALTQLMENHQTQEDVQRFFAALVKSRYRDQIRLLALLLSVKGCRPACINALLQMVRLSKEEKVYIFQCSGPQMLESLQKEKNISPVLQDMAQEYVQRIAVDNFSGATRYLLYIMYQPSKHDKFAALAHNWYFASMGIVTEEYLPSLETVDLATMVQAMIRLDLYRNKHYMDDLFWVIVKDVSKGKDLSRIVEGLGRKPLYDSSWTLFQKLAEYIGEIYNREVDLTVLVPYIAYALIYVVRNPKREVRLDDVFPKLFKNVHPGNFEQLYNVAWNQLSDAKQRELWHKVASRYRPQTWIERTLESVNNSWNSLPKPFSSSPKSLPKFKMRFSKTNAPVQRQSSTYTTVAPQKVDTSVDPQAFRQDPPVQPHSSTDHAPAPQQAPSQSTPEQEKTRVYQAQSTDEKVELMVKVYDLFLHWRQSVYEEKKQSKEISKEEKNGYSAEIVKVENALDAGKWEKLENAEKRLKYKYIVDNHYQQRFQKIRNNMEMKIVADRENAIEYIRVKHKETYQELPPGQVEEMLDICIRRVFMSGHGAYSLEDEQKRTQYIEKQAEQQEHNR